MLKSVCACITDTLSSNEHIIAPNEGASIGLAIGSYLATKSPAVVYMQNSGLSNALNPLISIAHKKVYQIPLVLLIGWRGSPKVDDEPQHNVILGHGSTHDWMHTLAVGYWLKLFYKCCWFYIGI